MGRWEWKGGREQREGKVRMGGGEMVESKMKKEGREGYGVHGREGEGGVNDTEKGGSGYLLTCPCKAV